MAVVVAAPRAAVWSAVADPLQVMHWRPGATHLLLSAPRHPIPGRVFRLRCLLQDVPICLEERTLEAEPQERLRSSLRFGLFHCEEIFTLAVADPNGAFTRVGLRIATASETPLVGDSLDRFAVRRFATELTANSLAALRDWCELGHPLDAQGPLDVEVLGHQAARVGEALSREH
jgi:hypothetical protein